MPDKFILLGEDDADDEELLKEVFSSLDSSFSMMFANNGRKLVAHIEELPDTDLPCLIILDYNMPELKASGLTRESMRMRNEMGVLHLVSSLASQGCCY